MNKQVELKDRKVIASKHVKLGQKNQKGQTYTDVNDIFYKAKQTPSFLTGSEVIRAAIKVASVGTSVAYPITPQSEAAALIGELFAEGYLDEYFRGESEFAVMGQCAGAAFGGHRVFTTTAGPGTLRAMENFPMWAGSQIAHSGLRDLPWSKFSIEHSAGYLGNALSSGNRECWFGMQKLPKIYLILF